MAKKKTDPNRIKVEEIEMPPKRKIEEQDRLNASLQFSYEHCCVDPIGIDCRFSTWLTVKEQPWTRELREIGPEWMPINKGCWLEPNQIGYFVLINLAAKSKMVMPSKKEKEEIESHFIELALCVKSFCHPLGFVRPGKFATFEVADFSMLRIRCLKGPVQGIVHAFPK